MGFFKMLFGKEENSEDNKPQLDFGNSIMDLPPIKLLPFEELIKILDEKSIEYDEREIRRPYFPLKDVEACMNTEKSAKTPAESNHRPCPLCGKPSEELRWIYFESPQWTWQKLCGRAGPMSICPDCGCLVEFELHMMN